MNREDYLAKAARLFGRLVHEVKVKNAAGLFDINTVAEDFYIPILSKIFSCPDLKNQNRVKANFPAVDLGCESVRTSIQITSDPSSEKVAKTLELFRKHGLGNDFDKIYVLVITEKQRSYSSNKLSREIEQLSVQFDPSTQIIDYHDLVRMLAQESTELIGAVCAILDREFAKQDRNTKFRDELENFLEVARSKVEFEKKSKKYIPSIFIETSSVKDQVRYFSNPIFFYRKINELVLGIGLPRLNALLRLAGQKPIEPRPQIPLVASDITSLSELTAALADQSKALQALRAEVLPLSMDRGKAKRFEPVGDAETFGRIWRFPIEANAYGLIRRLDQTLEAIELANAKVFLVTGMAGQGKTNFVCDLVENQFRKFRVPSIFIPARDLNGYSGQNRIFDFIVDNRYAPEVRNTHELLKLFDEVAREVGKPFIIAIDGINEVNANPGFDTELNTFLHALTQYDYVKALITCRSEFFDQRFGTTMKQAFFDKVFRVENLRSEMTERHKERLIQSYFDHFRIKLSLSDNASNFLRNDLLLLRIFCEIEEGASGRYVSTIYKGDIFERFLLLKVEEFEAPLRRHVVPTLHHIARRMLDDGSFTSLSTAGFDDHEVRVIERLIAEDIVLRSELPIPTLASAGLQHMSFTYDELRDFIIAHYLVTDLAEPDFNQVVPIFAQLRQLQIREGVFRYAYILARRHSKEKMVELCEQQSDFSTQYVNAIELIPPALQSASDRQRVREILASDEKVQELRAVAVFLFHRRSLDEVLNIDILVDHISSLTDHECEAFFGSIFSDGYGWRHEWRRSLTQLVTTFIERAEKVFPADCPPLLTFVLQLCGFVEWEYRETTLNRLTSVLRGHALDEQLNRLQKAQSEIIRRSASEIWAVDA